MVLAHARSLIVTTVFRRPSVSDPLPCLSVSHRISRKVLPHLLNKTQTEILTGLIF